MPIPFYNLHDQTAEEIAAELVRQIPAHTPEWRNPAPGDPGRALIDLFAFMADKLLYRVNLLPERQRLMFLRLLDMPMRAATPARGLLQLTHSAPRDHAPVALAARTLVPGKPEFETTGPATILPVTGMVYAKRLPTPDEASSVAGLTGALEQVYEVDNAQAYVTTPLFAGGRADDAGFDVVRDTRDQCLWVALLAADAPADKAAFREEAFKRRGAAPLVLNVGFAPRAEAPVDTLALDAPKPRPEAWAWQMPTGRARPDGQPEYITLAPPVENTTEGFTRPGVLRLLLPDVSDIGLPENDPDVDVLAGVGDRPPRIDDPDTAARLVGWLRLAPRETSETFPLSWLGLNAVGIEARRTLRNIVLGQATSGSDQQMRLPAGNVDPDSLLIDVQRTDGAYETWTRVDDFLGHDRKATVYMLDPEAGTIRFGDGMSGRVPPRGVRVRATLMRHGGGGAGNIAAGTLAAIAHPRLKALQPVATAGGAEAETLAEAEIRLPAHLRHSDRAVTERDFRDLAPLTPGVELSRVEVLPRFQPFQRLGEVPGCVSVLVLPQPRALTDPAPRPDRAILQAVTDYLDARRPMGTELHVIGPEYRQLSVSASVKVREGFAPDTVLAEVETALRLFLAPTAPGGRDGSGWALGRTVSNLELEVIAARVAGLEAVYGVNLFERGASGGWVLLSAAAGGAQGLTLERWMLPELREVVLGQDPAGPAGAIEGGGGGSGGGTPIPVVPEMC